ncbi:MULTISPECIES: hypothetical protein [Spirulina sp. CCY15215]|nr:hypothetical protein [Spirulina major]
MFDADIPFRMTDYRVRVYRQALQENSEDCDRIASRFFTIAFPEN